MDDVILRLSSVFAGLWCLTAGAASVDVKIVFFLKGFLLSFY